MIENFFHNRRMENPFRSAHEQFIVTSIDTLENREASRRTIEGYPGHIADGVWTVALIFGDTGSEVRIESFREPQWNPITTAS